MSDFEFDTGLDARAFAQAKFAQCLTEAGLIVRPAAAPPHRIELWKASGVREKAVANGRQTIVVWGPPIEGERLDVLLNERDQPDKALAAVSLWIQSIQSLLALGNTPPGGGYSQENIPLWPCAAIITQADESCPPSVFFAPPALARRGVTHNDESYVNPALSGMEAAAFTAAAMLYRVFTGAPPFSNGDISILHQDMRDNNFLPLRFAVPGLEPRLAALMHAAIERPQTAIERRVLERRALERSGPDKPSGDALLSELLAVIQPGGQTVSAASLIAPLPEPDRLLLEKEKKRYLTIITASIKTRRFIARNKALILGVLTAVVITALIVSSIINTRAQSPTAAGMDPVQVIETYYRSLGELDHQMMEACVADGAGKDDINTVVNLFVITKTRQSYERNTRMVVFPAHQWEGGALPDTPLFGAADLRVTLLGGKSGELLYRVDYTYWIPAQAVSDTDDLNLSVSYPRSDILTLALKKDNWRIVGIDR